MRVLVACEFSGVVREAFRALGHDAWSCDLLPSEDGSGYHLQGDVLGVLGQGWDLMIAHPPCQYLCNSGVKHLYLGGKKVNGPDPERWSHMRQASRFFKAIEQAGIPKIAIENPIPHSYGQLGKPTQTIQPWMFGHGEIKATCLWLKNLPKLVPTDIVDGRKPRVHHASPGPERWKERSRTLPGIAKAMAAQWGT